MNDAALEVIRSEPNQVEAIEVAGEKKGKREPVYDREDRVVLDGHRSTEYHRAASVTRPAARTMPRAMDVASQRQSLRRSVMLCSISQPACQVHFHALQVLARSPEKRGTR
jgi:hypothetical protein